MGEPTQILAAHDAEVAELLKDHHQVVVVPAHDIDVLRPHSGGRSEAIAQAVQPRAEPVARVVIVVV